MPVGASVCTFGIVTFQFALMFPYSWRHSPCLGDHYTCHYQDRGCYRSTPVGGVPFAVNADNVAQECRPIHSQPISKVLVDVAWGLHHAGLFFRRHRCQPHPRIQRYGLTHSLTVDEN